MDFKKRIVGTLMGAASGVTVGTIFGPSVGIMPAAVIFRRRVQSKN